ncbi:ABC transporter permease [Kutzneria sp. NPDC052558]|uniref:ABC transporter permease n=1 Tax=Kutzneria sp. NPDC052558 TaxID=3364121 RepID=UPI0037C56052
MTTVSRPTPLVAVPTPRRPRRRRFPVTLTIGLTVVLGWGFVAVFWPQLAPYDLQLQHPAHRFAPPGGANLLGTDQFGRDTFSRVLAGSRSVLEIAPLATLLALIGGTALGLLAGAYRRWVDEVIMRVLDAVLVFPAIIASVLFIALLGHSATVLVLVIGIAFVPIVTRSVRAATLVERGKPYVDAALLRGERGGSLLVREILPNVARTVLVEATSRLGDAIFAVATLAFLGLGEQPGSPDWGTAVSDNRSWLQNAPWTVLAPAIAIATLVVGVALIADDLRGRFEAR